MPNPDGNNGTGTNQFAGWPETIPYGDRERQAMLQRLAPLAGKPVPEPRRASQDRRAALQAEEPVPATPVPVPVPTPAQPPSGELYAQIASIPGASETVRAVFGGAA
jgi:hypothetical protein